ncbi:MAG: hypothetical protein JTT12_05590 [Candidatus Brockarchaeota archaeon]|nr:hypothetical protein [Candidatus Brockarchaeota archaeon]
MSKVQKESIDKLRRAVESVVWRNHEAGIITHEEYDAFMETIRSTVEHFEKGELSFSEALAMLNSIASLKATTEKRAIREEEIRKVAEERLLARIDEAIKRIEAISAPSEVLLRGITTTGLPSEVWVEEGTYYVSASGRTDEEAYSKIERIVEALSRWWNVTNTIVEESGLYKKVTYEFSVIWLDIDTINTLMSSFVNYPMDYFKGGFYLFGHVYKVPAYYELDFLYSMASRENRIPAKYKGWAEAVCTKIIPEIRRLKYSAIGEKFPVSIAS